MGNLPNSTHVVARATLLTPSMLKNLVTHLMLFGPEAWVYIASLLLSYFTLARQSNVFSLSPSQLGPHTLLVSDIACTESSLHVVFRSTKTKSGNSPPLVFVLPALPHHKVHHSVFRMALVSLLSLHACSA